MEQQLTRMRAKRGFVLPAVLFIALLGLLFGAGRLLLFKYQCQLRIDRQHEIDKVLAVRSVMQWLSRSPKTSFCVFELGSREFSFKTGSDRKLSVIVDPVEQIFPKNNNPDHFSIPLGRIPPKTYYSYDGNGDKMFDGSGDTIKIRDSQLWMGETNVSYDVSCSLRVDMPETGSWFADLYGRRYFVGVNWIVQSTNRVESAESASSLINDTVKLALIRRDGHWPLQEGEKAIVLEVLTYGASGGSGFATNNVMLLQAYENMNGVVQPYAVTNHLERVEIRNAPQSQSLGIQLANKSASLFYSYSDAVGSTIYVFSPAVGEFSNGFYSYFTAGTTTNSNGEVKTPDLSMVLDVSTSCAARKNGDALLGDANKFTRMEVWPAYEYSINVEYPKWNTNLATVVHLDMKERGGGDDDYRAAITYDTHGTENRGFRKDEREAERKRNGR